VKRLLCWSLFLLGLVSPLAAQEQTEPSLLSPAFPGVAEVIPQASKLTEQAALAETQIATLRDAASLENQLRSAKEWQEDFSGRIAEWGDPEGWNVNRLLETRARLSEQRNSLKKLLDTLSARLAELEKICKDWSEKKNFWENWEASFKDPQLKTPKDAFRKTRNTIDKTLKSTADTAASLVALQKEVTPLQEKNLEVLNRIDATLNILRKETFKKTARSFFDRDFYRQFNAEMWRSVTSGTEQIQKIRKEFLQNQGWIFTLQILVALSLALFIRHHRIKAEVTDEWQFILHHPWATGIFVSVSSLSLLYTAPPALWRLSLWTLAAFSASVLISGLLRNPRKIFMVYLLASLLVLSLALQVISFPAPLYRFYLAFLSLSGIPLLLLMASSNVRAHGGKVDGFTLALRIGAVVLLASFVAQIGGFSTLASRLIESSVETVFLGLFAAMIVRLGRGGIEYVLSQKFFRQYHFFSRFGDELATRLKAIFQLFVRLYAALFLLQVWRIYDTVGQAWESLLELGFTLGEATVSVRMVFLVGLALYTSVLASWVFRALLETSFFPRKHVGRGLRDSIKKLLHYTLVLIGFFFALNLVGLELKHFVVLAGAFGIGIGFGLQNIFNNFVSGIILLFERPIKTGDVVVLDNEWGKIKKIGLRSTVVETWDRAEIIVPNSQFISEKVTNWTLTTGVARVVFPVGVAYGSDVPLVLNILEEAARQHPDVLDDPPPSPIFVGFGESSLDFELRAWMTDVNKRLRIKSDLGQYIDSRFREKGVQIPFPQLDLHLRSVDEKILEEYKRLKGKK
jgi:potassium-dependent mechanosensitive channel